MTGTNDNRPDFQKMVKESSTHEWQYVIVYKLDRFSRNKYETAKYKKALKGNGVKLLSAMENIPDKERTIVFFLFSFLYYVPFWLIVKHLSRHKPPLYLVYQ